MFKLKRPCKHCPFRTDVPGYLTRGRAVEIAHEIANGAIFPCHETTVTTDDGEDLVAGSESQFCAGALILMETTGVPNQAMRMAERLGLYDADAMDTNAPVLGSFAAFVDHHSHELGCEPLPEPDEEWLDDCCEIVDAGCEAPAGYLVGGQAVPADNSGADLHACPECGHAVCDSCSDEDGVCNDCTAT